MSGGHRSVRPGKRVLVRMADGRLLEDRFLSGTDRWKVFERLGRIRVAEIHSMSPYKGEQRSPTPPEAAKGPTTPAPKPRRG